MSDTNSDRYKWHRETEHLNYNRELKVGQTVLDAEGKGGKVIEIIADSEEEPKGKITVPLGGDSQPEVQYAFINWQRALRIMED
jgi:hypothetical protein